MNNSQNTLYALIKIIKCVIVKLEKNENRSFKKQIKRRYLMKIKKFDLMEIFLMLRQKIKFGLPELVLVLYTFASWITRLYTPEIIKDLHWFLALQVTLGISIFLTFAFIIGSNIFKVDWYGKKSEKGLIITVVKFFSENISKEKLLRYFFFLD